MRHITGDLILSKVRQCRNWAEYRDLLARREGKRKGQPAHLWNREVTPLHDPTQPISTGEFTYRESIFLSLFNISL